MCGVSAERCTGFCVVRKLFGNCMVGLFVLLGVPLILSFVAMPGLCCFFFAKHLLQWDLGEGWIQDI